MLKNISNLEGVKELDKNQQKAINGGARVCGGTGGEPTNEPRDLCFGWGMRWYNGQCYICY